MTIQISTLANKVKKDKDHLKTLEKNINTEKAFSKLKDKQIDEALMKVDKVGFEAGGSIRLLMSFHISSVTTMWMVSSSFISI